MSGNSFGNIFRITTWGESHGRALGVTIDGCPAGIPLSEDDIQPYLDRRKPGSRAFATKRQEDDRVEILSGVFENTTTGTPISMVVYNADHASKDYSNIADVFRPGHVDYGFFSKYGVRDYRGGGRSSGRETLSRVAAGAVAMKILKELGICIDAYVISIGGITCNPDNFDLDFARSNNLEVPDKHAYEDITAYLTECVKNQDSTGGVVECRISGLKAGYGEPVFDKLDAKLAQAVFSIGAVKGFEIGAGFGAAAMNGSSNNDSFIMEDGIITKATNNSGGILGGISDGDDLLFRAAFKPTPSISQSQQTVNTKGEAICISIKGRHDPLIPPRAVVVVECMAAVTLVDAIFTGLLSRIDTVKKLYSLGNTK